MFERDLQRRLERIFAIKKVTFSAPSEEAPEQDTLFVTITDVRTRTGGNVDTISARVLGFLTVFSQSLLDETDPEAGFRLPFGYFAKRIAKATADDKAPFFFEPERDVPSSGARIQNLHERQVPFTFLYSAQHDPDRGSMTSLNFNLEVY